MSWELALPQIAKAVKNWAPSDNNQELINLFSNSANHVNYASNMAGHVSDYYNQRGDFKPLKRKAPENSHDDNTIQTSGQQATSMDTGGATAFAGGGSTGGGFRGKYIGEGQTNFGYEKYYHERVTGHSLKRRQYDFVWGMSKWLKPNLQGNSLFTMEYWGQALPYIDYGTTGGNAAVLAVDGSIENSICNQVYGNPVNFYIGDFFDNKLLSSSGGIMRNYNKVRLKSFTIEISPHTTLQSTFDANPNPILVIEKDKVPFDGNRSFRKINNLNYRVATDERQNYWIYRDIYGIYADSLTSNITYAPTDSGTSSIGADSVPRTTHQIRAFDNNLGIMSSDKPWSFTREINSMGSYYLKPNDIYTNRKKNIAYIVNELEGQYVSDPNAMTKRLPEYFNIIFAPINPPIKNYVNIVISCDQSGANPRTGWIPMVNISTTLYVKLKAQWELFDYNHSENPVLYTVETDPYYFADQDIKAAYALQESQKNTR